jgi:uncharacterized circularly permuted ATP-grasp superfamily protein
MVAAFDEMKGHHGDVRPAYRELSRWLAEVPGVSASPLQFMAKSTRRNG